MVVPKAGWFTIVLAHGHSWARLQRTSNDDGEGEMDDFTFWLFICITIFLVLMAGAMSGLTLGLMSLDVVDLEILKRSGSASQKKYAERIVPVLRRPHVLLVTLLVCNAMAAEALPLFLDRLADPITAVIVSVTVVLLFGEIIPQALCSRYGLQIGAAAAPFVRLLMWATWPLSWPIGWVLDRILGERHTALFRRAELKALVDIHKEGLEFGGMLSADEVKIIKGALDMTHKIAKAAMTPMDMVFMLPADALLDESTLTAILASGHSRIPVHKPGNRGAILGILLVKELILVEKDARKAVGQIKIRSLPYLRADTPMYDMLKLFEIGRSHMAVLIQPTAAVLAKRSQATRNLAKRNLDILLGMDSDDLSMSRDGEEPPSPQVSLTEYDPSEMEAVGIITIEDVLEELLQSEIVDETDQYVDNLHVERVNAALLARGLPAHLRHALSSRNLVPRIGGAAFMGGGAGGAVGWQSARSLEEALAAGAAAAEAGVFSNQVSTCSMGSDDGAPPGGPRSRVTFGGATAAPPLARTATPDAATIAAVAAALSPRHGYAGGKSSPASLASLASQHAAALQHHPSQTQLQQQSRDGGTGAAGHPAADSLQGPPRSRGGSLHGAVAAATALAAAAERQSKLPPVGPPPQQRRTRQLAQGIQDQMDLLQPLLRRVVTADASMLADAVESSRQEEGKGEEGLPCRSDTQ